MNETTDATPIFAPLWRRKWLILAVGLIVGVGSYYYYKRAPAIYQASTVVYLGAAAEEAGPGEKASSKGQGGAISEQAAVINTIVVEQVRTSLRSSNKDARLIRGAKVKARATEKTSFIGIAVEGHTARGTALLANAVAQAYIRRKTADHVRGIQRAINLTRRQLARLEAANAAKSSTTSSSSSGSKKSARGSTQNTASILQEANLNTKINALESSLSLPGPEQLSVVKSSQAIQISPKPRKNAIFGFVIGMVLAAIAVYLLARFDRRLRTLAESERAFKSRVLAALPKAGRPIVRRDGQPSPSRMLLEPLRRLDMLLRMGDAVNGKAETQRKIIAFTSPEAGDGKSTLAATLALTLRDAGQRVAVVEADFRRPVLAKLLGLEGAPGLADAVSGRRTVEEAMLRVLPIQPAVGETDETASGVVAAVDSRAGSLFVLTGGGPVANPPALLAQPAMSELLRSLAADFDWVLIDGPSPLEVSDVMPLLGVADGIVLVARMGHTRDVSARRLVQLLEHTSSAPVLGITANCATSADIERYGFASPNGRAWPGKLIGR